MWRLLRRFRKRPIHEQLTDVERRLIESYCAHAAAVVAERVSAQLALPGRVEREAGGKSVLFFADVPEHLRFANRSPELLLARFWLESTEQSETIVGHLWLANGKIIGLDVTKPVTAYQHAQSTLVRCELFYDPLKPHWEPAPLEHDLAVTAGPLLPAGEPKRCLRPVPPDQLAIFRRAWGETVPDDYVALCELTDGFLLQGWEFLGTRVRLVPLPSCDTLLLLAEGPDAQYLCTYFHRPPPSRVYHVHHDCDAPVESFPSFRAALARVAGAQ